MVQHDNGPSLLQGINPESLFAEYTGQGGNGGCEESGFHVGIVVGINNVTNQKHPRKMSTDQFIEKSWMFHCKLQKHSSRKKRK